MNCRTIITSLILLFLLVSMLPAKDKSFGYFFGFNNNSASISDGDAEVSGQRTLEYGLFFQYVINPNNRKIGLDANLAFRTMEFETTYTETVEDFGWETFTQTYTEGGDINWIAISLIGKYYPIRINTIRTFGIEPFVGVGLSPQLLFFDNTGFLGDTDATGTVFGM